MVKVKFPSWVRKVILASMLLANVGLCVSCGPEKSAKDAEPVPNMNGAMVIEENEYKDAYGKYLPEEEASKYNDAMNQYVPTFLRSYTVKDGDYFSKIVYENYGKYWKKAILVNAYLNDVDDINCLHVGDVLKLRSEEFIEKFNEDENPGFQEWLKKQNLHWVAPVKQVKRTPGSNTGKVQKKTSGSNTGKRLEVKQESVWELVEEKDVNPEDVSQEVVVETKVEDNTDGAGVTQADTTGVNIYANGDSSVTFNNIHFNGSDYTVNFGEGEEWSSNFRKNTAKSLADEKESDGDILYRNRGWYFELVNKDRGY